jgi:putative aldouronate transport system permease protein
MESTTRASAPHRLDSPRLTDRKTFLGYFWYHRGLYLLLLPALIYYFTFHYLPYFGATIAFKDFNIMKGILGSPWVGFKHFRALFVLDQFWRVVRNTLEISLLRLFFGFPVPLIIALLMNEVGRNGFKRVVQTLVYLPHFISWVILGGILVNLLSAQTGVVNLAIRALTGSTIGFLTDPAYFRGTLIWSMIWKEFGWGTVLYMATLAGIPAELYESAAMDGAGRFRRMFSITLPYLLPVIVVLLILRIGNLMQAGFEQIFVLYHPGVYQVSDILDTYVYRLGLGDGRFSMASAVGLFRSGINLTLLILANKFARMTGQQGIY